MTTKKIRSYLALGAITIALIVGAGAASKAIGSLRVANYPNAPVSVEAQLVADRSRMSAEELGATCQPEGATNLKLIAEAAGERQTFQVWRMNVEGQLVERTTTLFGTACGLANDSRYFQFPYEYVPREIAGQLSLQVLKYNIDSVGGLEAYQTGLIESLQETEQEGGSFSQFSSIDVQSWKKVGLNIPSNLYEVIEYQETKPYGS